MRNSPPNCLPHTTPAIRLPIHPALEHSQNNVVVSADKSFDLCGLLIG